MIKTFEFWGWNILFTVIIVVVSTALTGILAAVIGGYLVLGTHPVAALLLKWLYRWPLFIPFIVAAQCMRTFLAKNGMLNNTLNALRLVDVASLSGLLDWRGIIVTFVWNETPFVALLVSGAMASLDQAGIEPARNLGAGSLRILVEILLPQVAGVMTVGLILAFVTMLSVLSVPIMISGGSPRMMTDKLPPTYGLRYWGEPFKPTSDAFASPGNSIVIAVITVVVCLFAVPADYAIGRRSAPGRGLTLY